MFLELFSKQYINYTTVLTEESETLLTFGVLGRVFELEGLDDDGGEEDGMDLFYLLLSLSAGLVTALIIMKIFRF